MKIGSRSLGAGKPVFIVAELSANHRGSLEGALGLVEVAGESGADAVKLQTYTPDSMTLDASQDWFLVPPGTPWSGRRLHSLYAEAQTPWDWHSEIQSATHAQGMEFFSTPFDASAVEFLETLDVPAYKIASFELVDLELIERVAATRKPIIISTGMATLPEIERAVDAARGSGATDIALLKCTSAYPTDPGEVNLRSMVALAGEFGVEVGLSDHTLGSAAAIAAVALGATIVEKHLITSRSEGGPDSSFSLDAFEFKELVEGVRFVEESLGEVRFGPTDGEAPSVKMRRSLFVTENLEPGTRLSRSNLRALRPGSGLEPRFITAVLGRRVNQSIDRGTPLAWELLEPDEQTDVH